MTRSEKIIFDAPGMRPISNNKLQSIQVSPGADMSYKIYLSAILALMLASCDSPSLRVTDLKFGSSDVLATTGNLRLVTERLRPMPDGYPPLRTVCTEPSPDYAVAFGQKFEGDAKVTIAQRGSGEGGAKFETTEAVTSLGGRAPGVLALRDGLYAACQAYANGAIGHDAYALILSQYGTLLVALMNGKASPVDKDDQGRRAVLSALVVSCISEFDKSRLSPGQNSLLDTRFCRNVLARGLAHSVRGG